jgi:hypothetical protein
LTHLHRMREGAADNALSLAAFLSIPEADAAALLDGADLFAD